MPDYLALANSAPLFAVVGVILLFIVFTCVLFIVKSWKAGLKLGMDKKLLRNVMISSASFTVLPSISILLGVIALAGSLGIPISWLRLSVIGNLQYEATVASIAAEGMGTALDSSVLSMDHLVTIMLVMTVGIIWGCVLSITTLKQYSRKLATGTKKTDENGEKKPSFAGWAMTAMFIGLCATFVGSYVGKFFVKGDVLSISTALFSALVMAVFQFLIKKKGYAKLENFSLALSMLFGMCFAVLLNMIIA